MATRSPYGRPKRTLPPKPPAPTPSVAVRLTDAVVAGIAVLRTTYGKGPTDAELIERAVIDVGEAEAPRVVSGDDV